VSTKQKVLLIAVLVLLVALFVVAVAGRDPGNGSAAGHHGFVEWLSRFGGKRAAVPTELVAGPCRKPDDTLQVTGTCTLHVADPKALKILVLRSATPFVVAAPAPGDADFTARDTVEPGDNGVAEARIAVDKETTIDVACVGSLACVLTIGEK